MYKKLTFPEFFEEHCDHKDKVEVIGSKFVESTYNDGTGIYIVYKIPLRFIDTGYKAIGSYLIKVG